MKKTSILLSAALMFFGLTAKAQTTITFDAEDYKAIGVYDKWEESPFRTGELEGNAGVALNPSTTADEVLGVAPNSTGKVVAFQRSRYGSNVYGVRIDLKEPIRVTKELQYVHVMTYLKDKPTASRMMVIGLGKRLEASWSGQAEDDVEQFWSLTPANVEPKDGWQDIVVSFKGFSYSKEENANSGIDLHSLVIVPDVRTPDEDVADWVAYFDEIVVDNNPDKRFSTEQYALTYDKEAAISRGDRSLNKVGLTVGDKSYESAARSKKYYSDNTTTSVFSAKAGDQVQPTFGYTGAWMSAYVYTDWGRDALFKDALNANGTPAEGSDVVSYNAYQIGETWYKSDGTTRSDGNGIGQGVPTFTVPAGTANGFYRMRYKVDWNSINPAGATEIISNGGGIVDVMLDVHGDEVTVNASQLNGDIYAADGTDLINYVTGYEQPLEVKIVPAPGFVQYGFSLKYGYNVAAKEQLDDKGNPNWIEVNVPYTEVAGDGTYTIPAEYLRGSQVSITGDMQQVQQYSVAVETPEGFEGQGGAVYANIETPHGGTVNATQFFSVEQVEAIAVEGYTAKVTLNDRVITVTYTLEAKPYQEITSLSELKNYKLYQIKSKNNEGYLAWNTNITDTYLSLRGVTNFGSGEPSAEIRAQYAEEVDPFDEAIVWRIIKEGEAYYLYHPAKKAYVTRSGRDYQFTDTKTALDAIHVNNDGSFAFHAGGGYSDASTNFACIVTNENETAVRNWTSTDHGAKMQIIENPNVYTLEYTVEVVGGTAGGGITLDGTDYAQGEVVQSTAFLTAADVTAKAVAGYEAEVTLVDGVIRVAYAADEYAPVVVTAITEGKFYTLECRSGVAHNTARFIGITDDGKINGQAAEATFIKFEKANDANGYYIKLVDADKYLNHNGSNISASAERNTVWTLGVPTHTANVVTFTIGNDKYLNNNGSDCTDGTCLNLKANYHKGGPGSGNACSLWQLTEYTAAGKLLVEWKESVLPYLGYVGGYPADLRDEIEAVQTLAEKEAFEAAHEVLAINADTYYRLVCVSPKTGNNGDTSYNTLTFDGQDNLVTRPTDDKDWNQLFQFEDAGNGKFYLKSTMANAYLNKIAAGNYRSKVVAKDAACKLSVSFYEGTVIQWRFHNSESSGNNSDKHCLFAENDPDESVPYACAGWDGGKNSASAWRIVPVNNLAYALTVSAAGYATLYLDCAVAIPENVEVYIAESIVKGTDSDRLMMTQVTDVLPANTGVIVRALPGSYGLMKSDDEPSVDVEGNMLKGTTTDEYIDAVSGHVYYVLANKEGIGMYRPILTDNRFKNNANKAYLEVNPNRFGFQEGESDTTAPGGQLSNRLRFDFGGTTSIQNSEFTIDNSQFIYDLMGRRVENPTKGIYIVNGKKVIVK